ncbi:MFS transporter [Liquorilactobacillus sicerae]|uniref:MFS transporter n=1 Tax=Liquorilactobacillus sicerae TaxID=1416943 RepID=UPI002480EC4A|nr:MFS transporter [Liquorilactobacillus sicerae]
MQSKNNHLWTMLAIFVATFMTSVEVTIVTTALPEIIAALHGLKYQSWIMSSYLLTTAISTLIYGKLADTYGRKLLFKLGVVLFTIGSLLSGLAPNIFWLIIARGLQGCGAGAVIPLTFTIIADLYSFKERARILAFTNTAWGFSALIGPLLGGFLVEKLSWHWVFFVNVPLGVFVWLVITIFYQDRYQRLAALNFDLAGCCWLAASLTCLLLGIQLLQNQPIFGIVIITLAGLGSWCFLRQEKKATYPLLPLQIFNNQTFNVQIMTATILSGVLIGYQVYFPIWLQSIYQANATKAGLVVTSSSVMWLATSLAVGPLLNKFSPRKIALTVILLQALSYLSLLFVGNQPIDWIFYLIAAISGGGMGIVITMNIMLSQQLVTKDLVASASALITLGRSLGQTIMTGIYGAVFNTILNFGLPLTLQKKTNQVISGSHSGLTMHEITTIISSLLIALHVVFGVVLILFILVLICNYLDPNRQRLR